MHTKGFIDPETASIYSPYHEKFLKEIVMRFDSADFEHYLGIGAPQMKIWYLAHPVEGDEQYSVEENLEHVLVVQGILHLAGILTVIPWYTWVTIYGDKISDELRAEMLAYDCEIIKRLKGNLILSGHKIAKGMEEELGVALVLEGGIINLVGVPDRVLSRVAKELD